MASHPLSSNAHSEEEGISETIRYACFCLRNYITITIITPDTTTIIITITITTSTITTTIALILLLLCADENHIIPYK
jgi:hypothetical protein